MSEAKIGLVIIGGDRRGQSYFAFPDLNQAEDVSRILDRENRKDGTPYCNAYGIRRYASVAEWRGERMAMVRRRALDKLTGEERIALGLAEADE